MLDHLLKGARVVDGMGNDAYEADVGVKDGVITAIAKREKNNSGGITDSAKNTYELDGLVLCPGFIDPHTHYDAQVFWDPYGTPSNLHGVTTAISGNCGFTLAPINGEEDADYLRKMMAQVEGMPLTSLKDGLSWDWSDFGSYLEKLDGKLGINIGFLAGHSAIRRKVMGERAVGKDEATEEDIEAMSTELRKCIASGALGFSSSQAYTHSDGNGDPIPSRWAEAEEMLALAQVTGEMEGTTLEYITDGCMERFSDDEMKLMAELSATANRPLNWNVLTVDAKHRDRVMHQASLGEYSRELGGRVIGLTMPTLIGMNLSFGFYCALYKLPEWEEIMSLPAKEKTEKLKDPSVREFLYEKSQAPEAGVFLRLTGWETYRIGDVFSKKNEGLSERRIADIARERGGSGRGMNAFDTLCDIVVADGCRTILWPHPTDDDPDSWALRAELWDNGDILIGGSDAGAHLDRMCGANYPTDWLGDTLRGRKLTTMESAIQKMTDDPARLFGLKGKGRIQEGYAADIVVFDPETIDAEPITIAADLPGDESRLHSDSVGIKKVFIAGNLAVEDGKPTGELAGKVLRAGIDTETVTATNGISSGD